jgi:hypothetical protein
MREEDIQVKAPIMSFYFGLVDVGWIYLEPPHLEIRNFQRADIDFDTLADYYPDLVITNLHLKNIQHYFSDAYILRIQSKDVKEAFKTSLPKFEPYMEYFDRIYSSIYVSTTKSINQPPWILGGYRLSPAEKKTLKQLVYTLYLLEMNKYITYPLLTEEDA